PGPVFRRRPVTFSHPQGIAVQDACGGCDGEGEQAAMWRASRSRIQASSTGSPSIAMELATWRGMASK
ncbi:MAG: hypothetical protein OXH24_10480, partial [Cyanobacteria bacterium MAG IRC3_bin_20]|nr:hypothetical protein [Cyanobacteria bacterium MAG IRC3_bin_20]